MLIDFANLQRGYLEHKEEIDAAIAKVVQSQHFILGPEVESLERELEQYTGSAHAITCSSGTDALLLALMAIDLQPGDEVITTPFTFISTGEVVARLGAIPVFVDIEKDTFNINANLIEEAITQKTRAIMPVSLFGQTADMDQINSIADKHNLIVIEDAAQSFGATYKDKRSCNLSHIGCTSFFPAKPLGCYGDGGAIFTNSEELADKMKSLRVHGQAERYIHKYVGIGGRLDALQAAILRVKLRHFDHDLAMRQQAADYYTKNLDPKFVLPQVKQNRTSAWAQYSIRARDRNQFQTGLKENGIPTAVYYPKPLYAQECFSDLLPDSDQFPVSESVSKDIVSLPMNPYMAIDELAFVTKQVNSTLNHIK